MALYRQSIPPEQDVPYELLPRVKKTHYFPRILQTTWRFFVLFAFGNDRFYRYSSGLLGINNVTLTKQRPTNICADSMGHVVSPELCMGPFIHGNICREDIIIHVIVM